MVLELGEAELTVKAGCLSPDNKQEVREGCYQQSVWQRPCARESEDCLKRVGSVIKPLPSTLKALGVSLRAPENKQTNNTRKSQRKKT